MNPELLLPKIGAHVGEIHAVVGAGASEIEANELFFLTCQKRPVALARFIAMKVARDRTGASLPVIGKVFQRHHTTILHGITEAEKLMAVNPWAGRYAKRINELVDQVIAE